MAFLNRAGATLNEAMQLARHSDPKLSMKVYGRAKIGDLASAIDRLPSLSSSQAAKNGNQRISGNGD